MIDPIFRGSMESMNENEDEYKRPLSRKFKDKESQFRIVIPKKSIVAVRLDGKAFHSFTKQYERPYDLNFMDAMNSVAKGIIESNTLSGFMFAYVQSDEVTVFFNDTMNEKSELSFNGRVEKMTSILASVATGSFLRHSPDVKGLPLFDARVLVLEDVDEVQEYMDWRRLDARKNAITMAVSMLYTHKELLEISTPDRLALLDGTKYEVLPDDFFNGRLVFRGHDDRRGIVVIPALRDVTEALVNRFR